MGDIFSWPPQWIPQDPTVEGYKLFFGIVPEGQLAGRAPRAAIGVERWFINSAIVATTSWDMLMAGSVIATLPMVLVFMIFQRHFIRGISLSGMKA